MENSHKHATQKEAYLEIMIMIMSCQRSDMDVFTPPPPISRGSAHNRGIKY